MKNLLVSITLMLCLGYGNAQLVPHEAVPGMSGREVISLPHVKRGDTGWHLFVLVKDDKGFIYAPGLSCPHGTCESWDRFAVRLKSLNDASDSVAAFKQAWADNVKFACNADVRAEQTARGAMCRERWTITRNATTDWLKAHQPVPKYAVKANGTATTRPAYALTDGVRGTKEIGRATVGQSCDLSKPKLASGSDWWAEFGETGKVALCAQVRE